MKNLCTLLSCFLFVSVTKAQFTPGQTLLTGQVSFNESSNYLYQAPPSGIQKSGNLYTSFGYATFKKPLLLSGFGLSYSHNYTHYNAGVVSSDQQYQSNAFRIFYTRSKLKVLAKNFYLSFTGNAGLSYAYNRSRTNDGLEGFNGHAYGGDLSAGLGIVYRMDKHFLLNLNLTNLLDLSYSGGSNTHFNPSDTYKSNSHNFAFETGLTSFSLNYVVFGVSYLIK